MVFILVCDDAGPFPWSVWLNNALETDYLHLQRNTNLQHAYLLWFLANMCDGLSIGKSCGYIVSGLMIPPVGMSDNLDYYRHGPAAIYQNTAKTSILKAPPKTLKITLVRGRKIKSNQCVVWEERPVLPVLYEVLMPLVLKLQTINYKINRGRRLLSWCTRLPSN